MTGLPFFKPEFYQAVYYCDEQFGGINKMGKIYVLRDFMARSKHQRAANRARNLTNRQREIAALVSEGHSNKLIAQKLGLSEGTVKTHLHTIYARLGVRSRTELRHPAFCTFTGSSLNN